uniref:NADH-ubiquinone oxidoreductase chain 5 n=1 Tax=Stylosomus ilicicola TaxID=1425628 RepID=A0A3G1GRG7_9CUCU|nr:NADH dehydrogenase subunit 5 [Stylosomus ilicicola]
MSFSTFFSSLVFLDQDYLVILEFNLMSLGSTSIMMTILLDWMSLMFMSFVTFISGSVILYSSEYMHGDINLSRFILLVVLFVVSMIFLIISPNLMSIMLGWDGLGLVSYCLVIYYQNIKSYNAGMITALTNRIGDVALLMSIAWIFNYGSWNYFYYLDMMKGDFPMNMVGYFVVLAAMTKSAQIPFSSWLPAAMAAPTPVSSLVHSSTLVTAGVYLLIRFNYCFSAELFYILLFFSSLTMFMSGLGANFEFDLKKVIALSTLSQLGLMMSILALGEWKLAFFHLLIHALFKALLFMCAGSVIHSFGNNQDIRYLGSLINQMPLTMTLFNLCNFSLCGLPFLSGFYSKDLIVEMMSMGYLNIFIYILFYLSVGLTVSYSARLAYFSVVGDYNFISLGSVSEEYQKMMQGMSLIILFVVFSGAMFSWLMFVTPYFICLPFLFKIMTLLVILSGAFLGYEFSKMALNYTINSSNSIKISVFMFLGTMWNMPSLSTVVSPLFALSWGKTYFFKFDQGWMEFYGVHGISQTIFQASNLQKMSMNHFKIYYLLMLMWIMFLFMFL